MTCIDSWRGRSRPQGSFMHSRHLPPSHQIGFALRNDDIIPSGNLFPVCLHTWSARQALPARNGLGPSPPTLIPCSTPREIQPTDTLASQHFTACAAGPCAMLSVLLPRMHRACLTTLLHSGSLIQPRPCMFNLHHDACHGALLTPCTWNSTPIGPLPILRSWAFSGRGGAAVTRNARACHLFRACA